MYQKDLNKIRERISALTSHSVNANPDLEDIKDAVKFAQDLNDQIYVTVDEDASSDLRDVVISMIKHIEDSISQLEELVAS